MSHRTGDLAGAQAAGAGVHTLGGAGDDSLHTSHVGLPSTVGTPMGVGDVVTEHDRLSAKITLCHVMAPPLQPILRPTAGMQQKYNTIPFGKLQEVF